MKKSALVKVAVLAMVSCHTNYNMKAISSIGAPKAIGPYSQAIQYEHLIFLSGQIGLNKETGKLEEDFKAQTIQALENIKYILEEAGSDFDHVPKVTIFLTDMKNYSVVTEIYKKYFPDLKPARSVVQVSNLPKDALIEIECIAVTKLI